MGIFSRNPQAQLDALLPKLDAARLAVLAKEQELQERAVDAAVADDPGAALQPYQDALAQARATVDALELAEMELRRQVERERAAAMDAAEKARIRAIQQHRGTATKAARRLRVALEEAVSAWRDIKGATGKIERLLRPNAGPGQISERTQLLGAGAMSGTLKNIIALEVARQCAAADRDFPFLRPEPWGGFAGLLPNGVHPSQVDPIETQIARRFDISATIRPAASRMSVDAPTAADPAPDVIDHEMERIRRLASGEDPVDVAEASGNYMDAQMERVRGRAAGEIEPRDLPAERTAALHAIAGGLAEAEPEDAEDIEGFQQQLAAEMAAAEQQRTGLEPSPAGDIAEAHRIVADPASSDTDVAAARETLAWRLPRKGK